MVNPTDGSLLLTDWTSLPQELVGLAQVTLNNLGVAFPNRPDLQDIGYWPATEVDPSTPGKSVITGTGSITSVNKVAMTAVRTDDIRILPPGADPQIAAAAAASRKTQMIKQANALNKAGKSYAAVNLLLQAQGIQS